MGAWESELDFLNTAPEYGRRAIRHLIRAFHFKIFIQPELNQIQEDDSVQEGFFGCVTRLKFIRCPHSKSTPSKGVDIG